MQANRERYATDLAFQHDLSLPQGLKLAELALHSLDPSYHPESLAHLDDPDVATAFVSSPLGPYAVDESVDNADAVACRALSAGVGQCGAWFVRACVAEHRGDLELQRSCLQRALALDVGFAPALGALGFLAYVEGDVARAGRLLAASNEPNADVMLHELSHQRAAAADIGRNEPCPCGSARKHKHCCLGRLTTSLDERVYWLWGKAATWLRRLPQQRPFVEVACRVGGLDDPFDDELGLRAVLQDPMIEPLALLGGGLLERFVERLGSLLPGDEVALAGDWTAVRHRVWRVDATEPGVSLTMTDLLSDETVEAVNGRVSRCTEPGEVVFAAVLPTPSGWLLPAHPSGLDPLGEEHVLGLLEQRQEPVAIAAEVYDWMRRGG